MCNLGHSNLVEAFKKKKVLGESMLSCILILIVVMNNRAPYEEESVE